MENRYKLVEVITQQSIAEDWLEAKKEWYPFDFYCDHSGIKGCCCGKFPILNVCVIKHKVSDKTLIVGNCCITKFMDFPISNKIFTSGTKLRKDIAKSLNIDVIHHLKEINIINDYEYQFYLDRKNKRKLTDKQKTFKIKINQKFLNWLADHTKPHHN